jgi:tricorn protease
VAFVAEDDLWQVPVEGGLAHRLTANPGSETFPRFSPDGDRLAFVGRDEGRLDVYLMEAGGGPPLRLTYFGAATQVAGWQPDGSAVIVATDYQQPFTGWTRLWAVPAGGEPPVGLPYGPARSIGHGPGGGVVVGRAGADPARWKRYRGGRAGSLWIDRKGSGEFTELIALDGNLADPMWIGRRIYFLSDHEGVGNIYSVTSTGSGLQRHTGHDRFYVRFPSTDGRRIVYQCGADLWLFDPTAGGGHRLEVGLPSSQPQRNRRFVTPDRHLEKVALHPAGQELALVARGASFTMPLWEGAPRRLGPVSSGRRRLASWVDGERIVAVTDERGEEELVVEPAAGGGEPRLLGKDLGRIRSLHPAPGGNRVALTNHRHELLLVDLARGGKRVVHHSPHSWIQGVSWSPDGRWLAFSATASRTTSNIFLYQVSTRRTHRIGRPDFIDWSPAFDPEGKYLSFLSARTYDPVPDQLFHDYGFPRATNLMLVPLAAGVASPFEVAARSPRPPGPPAPPASPAGNTAPSEEKEPPVVVDLEGLADRVVAYPVPAGIYRSLRMARAKAYVLAYPPPGSAPESEGPRGRLESWDFATDKHDVVAEGVERFDLSADGKVLMVMGGQGRLRVVPVGWKEDKSGGDRPGRESGLVDLDRIRIEVNPGAEWRQMFSEAWRLQRDYFWSPDMGGVDWVEVHDRYRELVDRVASRAEFSDLLWEMQGELGTSHAYELGGDYRPEPEWTQGHLGADLRFERGAWRVVGIPRGDSWIPEATSPLATPGVEIKPGDRILEVEGRPLSPTLPPEAALVERAGRTVALTVARGRQAPRRVVVRALTDETRLRYRHWVETNRDEVRRLSGDRAGYIHIPDMGPPGFAEFHRYWKAELDYPGLVIDVRFNRGGNVSQLLMAKLARRRLGWRLARWRPPYPFPDDSPAGPMVCLTNEDSGSDGDIFSHTFKQLGLGPLIGTRTWGGVVGIWPQQSLVDGTVTTQPEFGTWFADVGYGVENYGTEPDIEVVNRPQDYAAGVDRQLERGVAELVALIEAAPPLVPDFGERPSVRPVLGEFTV